MKWGEISPKELDEAVMLESALFREIPEELKNRFHDAPHLQRNQDKIFSPHSVMHPPSASLTAQRFLREQQVRNTDFLFAMTI